MGTLWPGYRHPITVLLICFLFLPSSLSSGLTARRFQDANFFNLFCESICYWISPESLVIAVEAAGTGEGFKCLGDSPVAQFCAPDQCRYVILATAIIILVNAEQHDLVDKLL